MAIVKDSEVTRSAQIVTPGRDGPKASIIDGGLTNLLAK